MFPNEEIPTAINITVVHYKETIRMEIVHLFPTNTYVILDRIAHGKNKVIAITKSREIIRKEDRVGFMEETGESHLANQLLLLL